MQWGVISFRYISLRINRSLLHYAVEILALAASCNRESDLSAMKNAAESPISLQQFEVGS
jgi:hypothetical protein